MPAESVRPSESACPSCRRPLRAAAIEAGLIPPCPYAEAGSAEPVGERRDAGLTLPDDAALPSAA